MLLSWPRPWACCGWLSRRYLNILLTGAGAVVGAIAALGVSTAAFGSMNCWRQWWDILGEDVLHQQQPMIEGNFGLSRLLLEWGGRDVTTFLLVVFAIAFLAAAVLGRHRQATAENRPYHTKEGDAAMCDAYLGICGGVAIMFLSARLAWLHYFIFAVPMLVLACRPLNDGTDLVNRRASLAEQRVCSRCWSFRTCPTCFRIPLSVQPRNPRFIRTCFLGRSAAAVGSPISLRRQAGLGLFLLHSHRVTVRGAREGRP